MRIRTMVVLAIAPLAVAAGGQVNETWPSMQGGPEHLGVAATGSVAPPLRVAWKSDFGTPGAFSAAVLTAGVAVANTDAAVVGFDVASGNARWKVSRAAGPPAPPAVGATADGRPAVVFTEGGREPTGGLVAIDASTRRRLWRTPLAGTGAGGPTIAGSRVIAAARDGSVYAVELDDGRVTWKADTDGVVDSAPAVAGGFVYVVAENRRAGRARLYALDVGTGKAAWTFSPDAFAVGTSSATVVGDTVYAGFGDLQVRALSASSGQVRWSQRVRNVFASVSTPASQGRSVYLVDRGGGVYRFDAQTGDKVWDYQFASASTRSAPLIAGNSIYVGLDDGSVAGIDATSGNLVWRSPPSLGPVGALLPAGDLLIAPSAATRGAITAYRHDPDGTLLDVPSPTRLRLPLALVNFAGAFALVVVLLLGVFRLALGQRGAVTDGSQARRRSP